MGVKIDVIAWVLSVIIGVATYRLVAASPDSRYTITYNGQPYYCNEVRFEGEILQLGDCSDGKNWIIYRPVNVAISDSEVLDGN